MLEYKIKLGNGNVKREPVQLKTLNVSSDLSLIEGYVPIGYNFSNRSDILVKTVNGTRNCVLTSTRVKNNGWVKGETYSIPVYEGEIVIEPYPLNEPKLVSKKYIIYDGVLYFVNNGMVTIEKEIEGFGVCKGSYRVSGDTVVLNTYIPIEDDYITCSGDTFYIDPSIHNEKSTTISADNGDAYGYELKSFTDCKYTNSVYYDKFVIDKPQQTPIGVEKVTCGKYEYYFDRPFSQDGVINTERVYLQYSPEDDTYSFEGHSGLSSSFLVDDGSLNDIEGTNLVCGRTVQREIINTNIGNKIIVSASDQMNIGDLITFNSNIREEVIAYADFDSKYVVIGAYDYLIRNDKHLITTEEGTYELIKDNEVLTIGSETYELYHYFDNNEFIITLYKKNGVFYTLYNFKGEYFKPLFSGCTIQENCKYINYGGEAVFAEPFRGSDNVFSYTVKAKKTTTFSVVDSLGSSIYLCEPQIRVHTTNRRERYDIKTSVCVDVAKNWENYNSKITTLFFYNNPIDLSLLERDEAIKTSLDLFGPMEGITLYTTNSYYNIEIPLTTISNPNPIHENIIKQQFYETEKEKRINPIVDMEKDTYYPAFKLTTLKDGKREYDLISEIKFNLHFRTRDLTNWKIIQNGNENFLGTDGCTGYFMTDYKTYREEITKRNLREKRVRSSELLGLLYYSTDDVFYLKDNIARSFLRVSLYDSTNPNTQSLLSSSTIWTDINRLNAVYIRSLSENKYKFEKITKGGNLYNYKKMDVTSEPHKGNDVTNINDIVYDENNRLSSQFVVKDKCTDVISSEGFNQFVFREYSTKLRPQKAYMKIEYNHAGIGLKVPFYLPTNDDGVAYEPGSEELIEAIKKGISLEKLYEKQYIPMELCFDEIHNKYVYYPSKDLFKTDNTKGNVLEWNLFEIKINDESPNLNVRT